MEAIVRAIDVGFGNTKYVLAAQGGRVECAHFASIAYDSAHDNTGDALGSKRKTVCVPVGGMWYEVGTDVALAADGFVGRNHHDDYIRTHEYRAFTAGALHFMKVDWIDLLVLGLPVADYMRRRAELQKAMTGTFEVGRNRTVEVKRVLVVAQPQGAMYAVFGDQANAKLRHGRTLVIDAGSRTFDWLVTLDGKVVGKMSDSVNRGVYDILVKIAAAVASETGQGLPEPGGNRQGFEEPQAPARVQAERASTSRSTTTRSRRSQTKLSRCSTASWARQTTWSTSWWSVAGCTCTAHRSGGSSLRSPSARWTNPSTRT